MVCCSSVSGLYFVFFLIAIGLYWQGACREKSSIGALELLSGELLYGNANVSGGFLQLVMSLFFVLLSINFATLLPFSYPLVVHLSVTFSLSIIFWGATVLSSVGLNWRSFLSKVVIGNLLLCIAFEVLEFTTIMVRGATLCVRISVNLFISIIFAKIFFSLSLALVWWSWGSWVNFSILVIGYFFAVGYYVIEWGVGLVQSLLFPILIVTYEDECVFSALEEMEIENKGSNGEVES